MKQFNKDKVFVLSALAKINGIKTDIERFVVNAKRFVEGKLEDRLYTALSAVDEFNSLSMDRKGEIVVELTKELSGYSEETGHAEVIYDESGFSSGAGVVNDPILKKAQWDTENDFVGC